LREQVGKKLRRIHAVCGIVRTSVDATGFGMVVTEIARRSLHADASDFLAGMRWIVEFGREGVQIDISIRTISRAQTAANAPVLDNHFESVAAPDGAHRASNHAEGIATLATGCGHQVLVEPQTFADEPTDALVCIRAGAHALVAARAFLKIQYEKALCLHQSLSQKLSTGTFCA
jgi:hypothetical protein